MDKPAQILLGAYSLRKQHAQGEYKKSTIDVDFLISDI
jgi:hypothetical protein